MKNKLKTIKLTPKFGINENNDPVFSGYSQTGGDMCLDEYDHIYELVKVEDYKKLETILRFAEQFLDDSQYAMYIQGLGMEGLDE